MFSARGITNSVRGKGCVYARRRCVLQPKRRSCISMSLLVCFCCRRAKNSFARFDYSNREITSMSFPETKIQGVAVDYCVFCAHGTHRLKADVCLILLFVLCCAVSSCLCVFSCRTPRYYPTLSVIAAAFTRRGCPRLAQSTSASTFVPPYVRIEHAWGGGSFAMDPCNRYRGIGCCALGVLTLHASHPPHWSVCAQ